MKSIKKVLALIIVFMLMAASFAACGRMSEEAVGNSDEEVTSTPSEEPEDTTEATAETTAESTPEATPEASDETTPEPSETPEAVQEETPAPSPESTDEAQSVTDETNVSSDEVLGSVDGSTYTNPYFGFSIKIPDGWFVATQEQMAQILKLTSDYLESSSNIDLTQQVMIPLLYAASSDPFSSTDTSLSNIYVIAQNISSVKSMIPDAKTYLNAAEVGMKQQLQGVEMTFGDIETLTINGQDVAKVTATTTIAEGNPADQTMYVALKGNYVLIFTASYESAELVDAMNSLSFTD